MLHCSSYKLNRGQGRYEEVIILHEYTYITQNSRGEIFTNPYFFRIFVSASFGVILPLPSMVYSIASMENTHIRDRKTGCGERERQRRVFSERKRNLQAPSEDVSSLSDIFLPFFSLLFTGGFFSPLLFRVVLFYFKHTQTQLTADIKDAS